jgi:predicted nucleotidyltransferase
MSTNEEIFARLRNMKPSFSGMKLRRVRVFGSRSRGENTPDSDLDLLVDPEDGVTLSTCPVFGTLLKKNSGVRSILSRRAACTLRCATGF